MPKSRFRKSAFKAKLRKAVKLFLIRPANGRCQICGYDKYIGNLSFHHKYPKTKAFNICKMITIYTLADLIVEASKCLLVCHNCHGEIHAEILDEHKINSIPVLDYTKYRIPVDVVQWYNRRKCAKCVLKRNANKKQCWNRSKP